MIITEFSGRIGSENLIEGETYKEESDETTGFREKVITEFRDKTKAPALTVEDKNGNIVKSYNLPVGAHIVVKEGDEVTVKLVEIDPKTGKFRLSMKELQPRPEGMPERREGNGGGNGGNHNHRPRREKRD